MMNQPRYEEYMAKVILEWAYPDMFQDLIISDRPDLTNKTIGIEVTQGITESNQKFYSLSTKKPNDDKEQFEKQKSKLIELGGRECTQTLNPYGVLSPGGHDTFKDILKAVKTKLIKLKKYTLYDHNMIFIFSNILADDRMLQKALQDFQKLRQEYELNFSQIFVSVPQYLYKFNCHDGFYESKELDLSLQNELSNFAYQQYCQSK